MTIPDEAGLVLVPGESIVVAAHGIGDARETLAEKCRFVVEVVLAATAVDELDRVTLDDPCGADATRLGDLDVGAVDAARAGTSGKRERRRAGVMAPSRTEEFQ